MCFFRVFRVSLRFVRHSRKFGEGGGGTRRGRGGRERSYPRGVLPRPFPLPPLLIDITQFSPACCTLLPNCLFSKFLHWVTLPASANLYFLFSSLALSSVRIVYDFIVSYFWVRDAFFAFAILFLSSLFASPFATRNPHVWHSIFDFFLIRSRPKNCHYIVRPAIPYRCAPLSWRPPRSKTQRLREICFPGVISRMYPLAAHVPSLHSKPPPRSILPPMPTYKSSGNELPPRETLILRDSLEYVGSSISVAVIIFS